MPWTSSLDAKCMRVFIISSFFQYIIMCYKMLCPLYKSISFFLFIHTKNKKIIQCISIFCSLGKEKRALCIFLSIYRIKQSYWCKKKIKIYKFPIVIVYCMSCLNRLKVVNICCVCCPFYASSQVSYWCYGIKSTKFVKFT